MLATTTSLIPDCNNIYLHIFNNGRFQDIKYIIKYYREKTKNELVMCRSTITSFEKEISSLKIQLNDVKFEKAKLEQARR